MDPTLETLLEIGLILLTVGTSAGYMQLRGKMRTLLTEISDLLSMTYDFAKDLADGGPCDTSRAGKIKAQIELVWCDLEELAPFIADIINKKSDLAAIK